MRPEGNNLAVLRAGQEVLAARLGQQGIGVEMGIVPRTKSLVRLRDGTGQSCIARVRTVGGKGEWQFKVGEFLDISLDHAARTQRILGRTRLDSPNRPWVFVWLGTRTDGSDRYFMADEAQVQNIIHEVHSHWFETHGNQRPKVWDSMHTAFGREMLGPFENRWDWLVQQIG